MASRYKLLSGEKSFVWQGTAYRAAADDWIRPVSHEMELAMIEAGALPAGAVAAENALGKPVTMVALVGGTSQNPGLLPAGGQPAAFTSRALTDNDDGDTLVCATAQVATVNTGLAAGFGCTFKGAITFAGTATVNDVRVSGSASPWCALIQTGTNTYDVVGGKA